jgi:ArsR family transcriptional regulator
LGNETRIRILNLLFDGPLCVCHVQTVLEMPQVMVSKHLGYLKSHGLVDSRREANWMVYSLCAKPSPELKAQFSCLKECLEGGALYRADKAKLERLRKSLPDFSPSCYRPKSKSACDKASGCCD